MKRLTASESASRFRWHKLAFRFFETLAVKREAHTFIVVISFPAVAGLKCLFIKGVEFPTDLFTAWGSGTVTGILNSK